MDAGEQGAGTQCSGRKMFGQRLEDLWGVFVREMPTYESSVQDDLLPIVKLTCSQHAMTAAEERTPLRGAHVG